MKKIKFSTNIKPKSSQKSRNNLKLPGSSPLLDKQWQLSPLKCHSISPFRSCVSNRQTHLTGAKSVQSVVNFYNCNKKNVPPNNADFRSLTTEEPYICESVGKMGEKPSLRYGDQVELAKSIPTPESHENNESAKRNQECYRYNVYVLDPGKSQLLENGLVQKNPSLCHNVVNGLNVFYEPRGVGCGTKHTCSSPTLVVPNRGVQYKPGGQTFLLEQNLRSKNHSSKTDVELEPFHKFGSTPYTMQLHENGQITNGHDISQQRWVLPLLGVLCCAQFEDVKRAGRTVFNLERLSRPKYTTSSFFEVEVKKGYRYHSTTKELTDCSKTENKKVCMANTHHKTQCNWKKDANVCSRIHSWRKSSSIDSQCRQSEEWMKQPLDIEGMLELLELSN